MSDQAADNQSFPGPLAGAVEYQADSIVSKILGKTSGGSATLFAFAEGQELGQPDSTYTFREALLDAHQGAGEGHGRARGLLRAVT